MLLRAISLVSLLIFSVHPAAVHADPPAIDRAPINEALSTRGSEVLLNGRKLNANWIQWRDGTETRLGISDTGARKIFGVDLLNSENPEIQPISWYENRNLNARFVSPYRYLDVTGLLRDSGADINVTGNVLTINYPPARITGVDREDYGAVQRIIVNLDRPAFWQTSQNRERGTIVIGAGADAELSGRFRPGATPAPTGGDEDDPGDSKNNAGFNLGLQGDGGTTALNIGLPAGYGMQVSSVNNPPRLVIDLRPDPLLDRRIVWRDGVIWQQKYIRSGRDWFPVTWLEIDPAKVNLKPVLPVGGTAPLARIATLNNALAAINGGYFNRNNRYPLGAIRVDGRWLSGPILGRGAIAWDNRGDWKVGRLTAAETLTAPDGGRIAINNVNSALVGAGVSRYTADWGPTYTPITEGETLLTVEGDRVAARAAGKAPVPIPETGYLLVIRNNNNLVRQLPVGAAVRLETRLQPREFERFPQILGGGPLLIEGGRIVLDAEGEKFSKAFGQQTASRSAIAITRDGKIVLAAVHNRVGGRGATLSEWAGLLRGMGAENALNLDGGSSTGIVLGGEMIDRSPVTAANVHNGIGVFLIGSP